MHSLSPPPLPLSLSLSFSFSLSLPLSQLNYQTRNDRLAVGKHKGSFFSIVAWDKITASTWRGKFAFHISVFCCQPLVCILFSGLSSVFHHNYCVFFSSFKPTYDSHFLMICFIIMCSVQLCRDTFSFRFVRKNQWHRRRDKGLKRILERRVNIPSKML